MPLFQNKSSKSESKSNRCNDLLESALCVLDVMENDTTVKTGIHTSSRSVQSIRSVQSSGGVSSGNRSSNNNSSCSTIANTDAYAKYLEKATQKQRSLFHNTTTRQSSHKAKKKQKDHFERNAPRHQFQYQLDQQQEQSQQKPQERKHGNRNDRDKNRDDSSSSVISGFSTYSFDTNYHTIADSSVAQIFGLAKVKFHGRKPELELLREIYGEVCQRGSSSSNTSNTNTFIAANNSESDAQPPASGTHNTSNGIEPLQQQHSRDGHSSSNHNNHNNSSHTGKEPAMARSVALVSGTSGTGKSALVKQFIEDLQQNENPRENGNEKSNTELPEPLFLSGKYNELSGSDPFSAIVEAFTRMSSLLVDKGPNPNEHRYAEDLVRIQRDVRASLLKEDVAVLTAVVPALGKILLDDTITHLATESKHSSESATRDNPDSVPEGHDVEGTTTQNGWNRLKYVLQLFVRTIATPKRPIILFLDDLQWADNGSLDLFQTLVMDKRIQNFMFIGTYRSDEVGGMHPLSQRLSRIQKAQPVERISIGNLSVEELLKFLHSHMKIDPYDCQKLAGMVHGVTNGNMFFVIQILVELNQQCALIYSEFKKEWEWDDVAGMLVLETGLEENLEEAFEIKIRRSPKLMKRALVTAAYARSTIDIDTLFTLMEMHDQSRPSSRQSPPLELGQLSKALDRAVLEGFLLNNIGSKYYSFAHNKVLQASYSLVPEGKPRERFRLSMGRKLYELGLSYSNKDDAGGETWMLFAAAEHLNSSISLIDTDPLFLAHMNLYIGERAAKISAYDQASKCLLAGLDALTMIPDYDPWEEEYDLTLRLHRAVADIELYLGRFDRGNEIGRRLLEKARDLQDGLPTFEALALALGREELHAEAMRMNRDAMIQLGEYPKHNRVFILLKELLIVQRYLKRTSDEDLIQLPKMTDISKDYALAFTRGLAIQAFFCDNLIEFLLASVRALRITFKYGLSGYSAVAIIAYGLIISGLNDHEGALRLTSLGRKIMIKCQAKSQESLFLFCAAHFVEGWVDPHEKTLQAYRQGYLVGMEVGDVENAFMNSFHAVLHARAAGSPLGGIEMISEEVIEQMDLYNVKSVITAMEQIHLPVQILSSPNVVEPNWKELGIEPSCSKGRRTGSENQTLLFWYISRVELGVYFRNFEFADQMADKLLSILPRQAAFVPLSFRLFYSGLAASGMARKMHLAGKRLQALKYRAKAKRFCKRLSHINRTNGPNSYHRELLLLADLNLPVNGKKPISYDRAINACLEVGHIHDAALGSELAGEYFLIASHSKSDTVASRTRNKLIRRYFTRARDLYHSWGAHAKVSHLHMTRGDFIDGRSTQGRNGRVVAIDIEDDFSSDSMIEDDFSTSSGSQVLYNPNLLGILAGIVPSSEATGIMDQERFLSNQKKSGNDDMISVISDIDNSFVLQ